MMVSSKEKRFSELVAAELTTEDSRSLWMPVAQELDRVDGGPDAAIEYLDAQRQILEERVRNLLDQVKKQIGG